MVPRYVASERPGDATASPEAGGAPAPATRVPLHVVVRFEDDQTGFVDADAANISLTGVYVRTRQPRPAGTRLHLELKLSKDFLIRAVGEVVWSRPMDESEERPAGMGVLFARFDGDGREILGLFIDLHAPRRARD